MATPLHIKYRPHNYDEVIGQLPVVKALKKLVPEGKSKAYLLEGPSGCGKTTLARIAAKAAGCHQQDIIEIDAATYTGVDDMRTVMEGLRYPPLGEGKVKVAIVDECHSLSANAWRSLLKMVEEPPQHLYWFFCTTDPNKVPDTIRTRCTPLKLRAVPDDKLRELIEEVVEAEKMDVSDGVVDLVVRESGGSPRQALVNLSLCQTAKDRKEAAAALRTAQEDDPVRKLCQLLLARGSWMKAMSILDDMADVEPEGVRIVVSRYMAAVAKNSKSDKSAQWPLHILQMFSEPFRPSDGPAPLMIAIGNVLFVE